MYEMVVIVSCKKIWVSTSSSNCFSLKKYLSTHFWGRSKDEYVSLMETSDLKRNINIYMAANKSCILFLRWFNWHKQLGF